MKKKQMPRMERHFLPPLFSVENPFIDVLFHQEVRFECLAGDDGGGGLAVGRLNFHGWARGYSAGEGGSPWGEPFGRQLPQAILR